LDYMVGIHVDRPHSIRHLLHGDVRDLPLKFELF
jgi:hypothetical protein